MSKEDRLGQVLVETCKGPPWKRFLAIQQHTIPIVPDEYFCDGFLDQ